MARNSVVIETKDNKYIDGVVSEEIAFCLGGGEILGEPTLTKREVATGTPYKKIILWAHRDNSVQGGEMGDDFWGDTLCTRLMGNSQYYQEAGRIKKWASMQFRYLHWYHKTDKALEQMVNKFFSSDDIAINRLTEIGTVNVMDTNYTVSLDVLSKGPIRYESICVGIGTALQGYYPLGKGCGGESKSEDAVRVYSMIQGTEYEFNLKLERKERPASSK